MKFQRELEYSVTIHLTKDEVEALHLHLQRAIMDGEEFTPTHIDTIVRIERALNAMIVR